MNHLKHLVIASIGSITLLFNSIYLPYNESNYNSNDTTSNIQYYDSQKSPEININSFITVPAANAVSYNSFNLDTFTANLTSTGTIESFAINADKTENLPLIYDSKSIDYMSYLPKMVSSKNIKTALDIKNPDLSVSASSAILFNAANGEVLFYKKPIKAVFPASTAKLLSSLVALDWCKKDEKITVGSEIKMIASDSSKAKLSQGEVLTVSTLLEAMLLPSGNDAAYVMAAYVGRKSLDKPKAKNIDAVKEFVRLMNQKAKDLGAENSCFVTPDGYDAIGQYTTAYDMGLIGVAAINSKTIQSATKKSVSNRTLISGEEYTWHNTNSLLNKDSNWYYSYAIGLKSGTTSIAGKCLISAARLDDNVVVAVVMDSTADGRWSDSIKLLKYGLKKLD